MHEVYTEGKNKVSKPIEYEKFWQKLSEKVDPEWHMQGEKGKNWRKFRSKMVQGVETYYGVDFPKASIHQDRGLRCEFHIYSNDPARTDALYNDVFEGRLEIDSTFGEGLEWEFHLSPKGKSSRIAVYKKGDISQIEDHGDYIEWFIRNLEKLHTVFG